MRPNSLLQPRSSCLPLWSGPHHLPTTCASTTGTTQAANGFPYRPLMLKPGRPTSVAEARLPYLAANYRLHIRGQRAALDTWRGRWLSPPGSTSGWRIGIREPSASSPHSLHRFCISLTYGLHPLVSYGSPGASSASRRRG